MDFPTTSSAKYPKSRSAAVFQVLIMPLRSLLTIASSDDSTIEANLCAASSMLLRSEISTKEVIAPIISSSAFHSGAKFTSTGNKEPSGLSIDTSTLRTGMPVLRTCRIGLCSCGRCVPSGSHNLTEPQCFSTPLTGSRPQSSTACSLKSTMTASLSQTNTAMGAVANSLRKRSSASCACTSVRFLSEISTSILMAPTTVPLSSRSGRGNARNGMRLPSGRSAAASIPSMARSSFKAMAIGH